LQNSKIRSTVVLGILLAAALVLSYVENLIDINLGIPMIKLGISNVFVTFVIYRFGLVRGVAFGVSKSVLSLVFSGRLSSLPYSLTGMLCSCCVMWLLKKSGKVSPLGVNVAGAVVHIWGQLIVSAIIFETAGVFFYTPVLTAVSALCGAVTYIPLLFVLRSSALGGEKTK